jgi:5S rRNA maturation endonuclease (ribonuclease M5)
MNYSEFKNNLKKEKNNRFQCPVCISPTLQENYKDEDTLFYCFKCDCSYPWRKLGLEMGISKQELYNQHKEVDADDSIESYFTFLMKDKQVYSKEVYKYYLADKIIAKIKYKDSKEKAKSMLMLAVDRESGKRLKKEANSSDKPLLYNSYNLSKNEHLIVAEGEKDVETLRLLGYKNVTTPFFYNNLHLKALSQFNKIIVIPDFDDTGLKKYCQIKDLYKDKVYKLSINKLYEHINIFPNNKSDISDFYDDLLSISKGNTKEAKSKFKDIFNSTLNKVLRNSKFNRFINELNITIINNPFLLYYEEKNIRHFLHSESNNIEDLRYTILDFLASELDNKEFYIYSAMINSLLNNRIYEDKKLKTILRIVQQKTDKTLIDKVISFVSDNPNEQKLFKAWLHQAAGRFINVFGSSEKYNLHFSPMLYSAKKGLGKSTFVNSLFHCFKEDDMHTNNLSLSFDKSDDMLKLSSYLSAEAGEIKISKNSWNNFKESALLNKISLRKKYERSVTELNINCAYILTSNHKIFKELETRRIFVIDFKGENYSPIELENISASLWATLIQKVSKISPYELDKLYGAKNRELLNKITSSSTQYADINSVNLFLSKMFDMFTVKFYEHYVGGVYKNNETPLDNLDKFRIDFSAKNLKTVINFSVRSGLDDDQKTFTKDNEDLYNNFRKRLHELGIQYKTHFVNKRSIKGFRIAFSIQKDNDGSITGFLLDNVQNYEKITSFYYGNVLF